MLHSLFTAISSSLAYYGDTLFTVPFVFIFLSSVLITIKSGFIQLRAIPEMFKLLFAKQKESSTDKGLSPRSALFLAMSTSIGMGNIAGPIVALGLGGPGALAGFLIATIFGAAITYVEVFAAIKHRKKNTDGSYGGGAMSYLNAQLGSSWGTFYAYAAGILLLAWTANQSNNVALLLQTRGIPPLTTALVLAIAVTVILMGGFKAIGAICDRMVPFMFIIYVMGTGWIVLSHADQLPHAFATMFGALFSSFGFAGLGMGYGMQKAIRWGFARAVQANETGVGLSTFPHTAAQNTNPHKQGVLAILSVYSNGLICMLSGLSVMVTGAWLEPGATFDIRMFSETINQSFPFFGSELLIFCAFLFAFSTVLGNNFNGSQCFLHVTGNRWLSSYHIISAIAVFVGCLLDVSVVWSMVDVFVIPVAIVNMIAILALAFKKGYINYLQPEDALVQ